MKNKKKALILTILCAFAALLLTACGGKSSSGSSDVSVDVSKLCQDLEGTIDSEVSEVSNEVIASTYFFDMDKIEEAAAALNSGSNACEVVVLKCKDSSYTAEAEELLKKRVESQSTLFASYNAPEVAKLDAAILKTKGNYVVFCVTDDTSKANEIIKEAGF